MTENYLTYEHPFNDEAAAKVRKNAEHLCGQRNKGAEEVQSVCSLSRCTTSYQCVDRKDPLQYEAPDLGGLQ